MNIILVSEQSTRNLKLSGKHVVLLIGILVAAVLSLVLALNFFSLHYADQISVPVLRKLLVSPHEEKQKRAKAVLHENLNRMAVKLGRVQAQILRLDELSKRLAKLSGISIDDLVYNQIPGQGGMSSYVAEELTFGELNASLNNLSYVLNEREDRFGALDMFLQRERLSKRVLPSQMPVDTKWFSSGYGYRIDPFSGQRAFHSGVDFSAQRGTPIKAAAGGVVVYSARHAEYGNMVEIDHGNDLVSRYAHASKRLVKLGQVVLQGQIIAEVGSTGRSTGPHLHFEIRHKGVAKNPAHFLKKPG